MRILPALLVVLLAASASAATIGPKGRVVCGVLTVPGPCEVTAAHYEVSADGLTVTVSAPATITKIGGTVEPPSAIDLKAAELLALIPADRRAAAKPLLTSVIRGSPAVHTLENAQMAITDARLGDAFVAAHKKWLTTEPVPIVADVVAVWAAVREGL